MNKIKFVYFDIGGVMANTDDYFKGATIKFGISLNDFTEFWQNFFRDDMTIGKITPQEFWNKAIIKFNLKNANDFNFLESWMGDYKENIDVHELTKKIAKKYKIGLISNLYPGMMPKLVDLGKVPDINYSAIVLSNEVGMMKPEKGIYELATTIARVKAEEILFIDDRQDFIEGGRLAGWITFWLDEKNIKKSIEKIEKILLSDKVHLSV